MSQDTATSVLCGDIGAWANPSTAIVDSIGYYPDTGVSVEELILKYGSPDIIYVVPSGIPEYPTTVVVLMFDAVRMRVNLPVVDGTDCVISKSSDIDFVNYFDETMYSEFSGDVFLQPWHGYGTYQPDEDP